MRVAGLIAIDIIGFWLVIQLLGKADLLLPELGSSAWLRLDAWRATPTAETLVALCSGLFLAGAYNGGDPRRNPQLLASGTALGLLIALWQSLWSDFLYQASAAVIGGMALVGAVILLRLSIDKLLLILRPSALRPIRTLMVGTKEEAMAVERTLPNAAPSRFVAVAQLDPGIRTSDRAPSQDGEFGLDDLPELVAEASIDTIVLCGRMDDGDLSQLMRLADAAGCRVLAPSRALQLANLTPEVHWEAGVPMIQLTRPGLHGGELVLKRLLDLLAGSFTLLCALPIMLVVALLVGLTSRGPIIFRQRRVGYAGGTFTIFKFRTMYVDAEDRVAALRANSVYSDGKLFKVEKDPRITPLGRWLRKLSLDELPQLLNVLAGDMSLVGPRPPLPREVDLYEDDEFIRFGMKPGITGPWQVSGRNRVTTFAEVLRIETAYLNQWTIWRDFHILLKTVPAVLKMDGAQ